MRMATVHQLRPSEESRHEIKQGIMEYHDARDRGYKFAPDYKALQEKANVDDGWFGDNPEVNPSLINKLSPYIMVAGLIGFVMLCTWLIGMVK